jgi:hypothetical protein
MRQAARTPTSYVANGPNRSVNQLLSSIRALARQSERGGHVVVADFDETSGRAPSDGVVHDSRPGEPVATAPGVTS